MKSLCQLARPVAMSMAFGLSMAVSLAATTTTNASVMAVKGPATVNDGKAKPGIEVPPGSRLTTGPSGTIDLNLKSNGPFLRLQSDSQLAILELSLNQDGAEVEIVTRLRLEKGLARVWVKKTSDHSRYVVETGTAQVTVQGSCRCLIAADGHLKVLQGCASIRYRDKDYTVCAGEAFDPTIPGLVDWFDPSIVIGCPAPMECGERPKPVGPVINISPVK